MGDKLAKSKNLCCHLVVFTRYSLLCKLYMHTVSIKRPGLDFLKKSLLNDYSHLPNNHAADLIDFSRIKRLTTHLI